MSDERSAEEGGPRGARRAWVVVLLMVALLGTACAAAAATTDASAPGEQPPDSPPSTEAPPADEAPTTTTTSPPTTEAPAPTTTTPAAAAPVAPTTTTTPVAAPSAGEQAASEAPSDDIVPVATETTLERESSVVFFPFDVNLTATVQTVPAGGPTPTGTVQLHRTQQFSGGEPVFVGESPLVAGTASFADPSTPLEDRESYSYVATFVPGSELHLGSVSQSASVYVRGPLETDVIVQASDDELAVGESVTLTASTSIGEGYPDEGTVRFFDGDDPIADLPVAFLVDLVVEPTVGFHDYSAQYLGADPYYLASERSDPVTVVAVGAVPTEVALTSDGPTLYGDEVELQATVPDEILPDGTRPPPSGEVVFRSADERIGELGTAPLEVVAGEATAVLTTDADLAKGTQTILAEYLGEDEIDPTGFVYQPSPTATLEHEVVEGSVTIALDVTSFALDGVDGGACVSLLAEVTPTVGSAPVTGLVTYEVDGSTAVDPDAPECPTAEDQPALDGLRFASPPTPVGTPFTTWLPAGPHTFGAAFDGDLGYAAVDAAPVPVVLDAPGTPSPAPAPGPGTAPVAPSPPVLSPSTFGLVPSVADDGATPADDGDEPAADETVEPRVGDTSGAETGGSAPTGDETAAAEAAPSDEPEPASRAGDGGVQRSSLVDAIPTPGSISWAPRDLATNVLLALLLIVLVALPAELVNSALKEHYEVVNRPFAGINAALASLEARLLALPNALLLVLFAVLGALIAGQLDPEVGWNSTSFVLFAALALSFVLVTVLLELVRIPLLDRAVGQRRDHRLRLFPLVLVLAAVFVLVSRVVDFQPGYIFGITCGLLLAEGVDPEDDARSLVTSAVLLLVTAVGAWLLWIPWADAAQGADPSLGVVFVDALLATVWISCLQAVLFGFAPLEALYGKVVQRWRPGAWLAVYVAAAVLLVQLLLHPSAGRWGGLPTTTLGQVLALFVVMLVASVVFWGWLTLRERRRGPTTEVDPAGESLAPSGPRR